MQSCEKSLPLETLRAIQNALLISCISFTGLLQSKSEELYQTMPTNLLALGLVARFPYRKVPPQCCISSHVNPVSQEGVTKQRKDQQIF